MTPLGDKDVVCCASMEVGWIYKQAMVKLWGALVFTVGAY